jgi:hypothetical protein
MRPTNSLNTGLNHFFGYCLSDKCAVRSHDHAKPLLGPVAGNSKDIWPQKGFSTCEDDYGFPDLTNLVEQHEASICVQFIQVRP